MKTISLLAILTLLASCGKTIENVKFVENDYIAPDAPEFALSFSDFDAKCLSYKYHNSFKRANSMLKMHVKNTTQEKVTLLNLGWQKFVTLEAGILSINDEEIFDKMR
jgi:hypothetical protein